MPETIAQRKKQEVNKMTLMTNRSRTLILAVTFAGAVFAIPQLSPAAPRDTQSAVSTAQAQLESSQFKNVRVNVASDGVATLTGTVSLYEYKADAEKRVLHAKGVKSIRDDIQVSGPAVSDQEIVKKLGAELAYNREGYGNLFDAITLQVHDGVVKLGGHAHDYPNRNSAVAMASTTSGVKGVIDNIEVDPVSQIDWGTRLAVARAIYAYPGLEKYAIDPVHPIRISVQNGHVELYGTVDSAADKEVAYLRANSVPGVFSVKNYIQVAGHSGEKQQ
jgi:hyperosmotically inducible periplasmic protein